MKRVNWKQWMPLIVAGAVVAALAIGQFASRSGEPDSRLQPDPMPTNVRTVGGVSIREPAPSPVIVPELPKETRVARAAHRTLIRRAIQRAISAEVKRDKRRRAATVASLKKDRSFALQLIQDEIARARIPEYIRQLDMLSKEVGAP